MMSSPYWSSKTCGGLKFKARRVGFPSRETYFRAHKEINKVCLYSLLPLDECRVQHETVVCTS